MLPVPVAIGVVTLNAEDVSTPVGKEEGIDLGPGAEVEEIMRRIEKDIEAVHPDITVRIGAVGDGRGRNRAITNHRAMIVAQRLRLPQGVVNRSQR